MKKILLILSTLILLGSCGTLKQQPQVQTVIRDSIRIEVRDSINWIPKEKIVNITLPNQESNLETSIAKSTAFTDSLGFLHHNLENKKGVEKHHKLEYRYIEKRDTTYIKVPVEVVKEKKYIPKFFWGTFVFTVLCALVFAAKIYLKFKTGAIQLPKLR